MKIVKVATHDGVFHADEVFALAVLKQCLEKDGKQIEIVRTRDLRVISLCDMAVDVGGKYDKTNKLFDHHQREKPGNHKNGIPYASFGLIWKHFGKKITSNEKVRENIERKLVMPIDALDNGVTLSMPILKGIYEFGNAQIISAISMAYGDENVESAFLKALEFAGLVVIGEIAKAEAKVAGDKVVNDEISKQGEPEVLVLEKYASWETTVSKFKNIKLVIFPDEDPSRWCIQTARDNPEVFGNDRVSFPKHWRGLTDEDLVVSSGVIGSVFCHTGGFFAVAKSRPAAIELANKAIHHKE